MSLWVVGGRQRSAFRQPAEWTQFQAAVVARVDAERVEQVLHYRSPPEHCPAGRASHVFKAASIAGDTAYLCTQTEVLVCNFPGFQIRRVLSLPCFNDLHHVTPGPDGTLFVAVTGLDAVAEITVDGELLQLLDVTGGNVWKRFSPRVDYRRVPTTKPHAAHPNYVFFVDGHPWVTRLCQRDAVRVGRPEESISLHTCPVHDGHVCGDRVLFTGVDGHIIEYNYRQHSKRLINLNSAHGNPGRALGWCRGLLVADGGFWVGFSRFRHTRLRENLSWLRHGGREVGHLPTRIALYDSRGLCVRQEHILESANVHAVFSIHQDDDVPVAAAP